MPRTKKVKLSDTQVFMSTLDCYRRTDGQLNDYATNKIRKHLASKLWDLEAKLPFDFDLAKRFFGLLDAKVTSFAAWNKLMNDVALAELSLHPDS